MRNALAIVVAVAWTASFTVELIGSLGLVPAAVNYHTPAAVHVLMGIVVGAFLGRRERRPDWKRAKSKAPKSKPLPPK